MNIYTNYQMRDFKSSLMINKQSLQTSPSFTSKEKFVKVAGQKVAPAVTTTLAAVTAGAVLAMQNGGMEKSKPQEFQTLYGSVVYTPKGDTGKSSLVVSRLNGTKMDLFEGISQTTLESPIIEHLHQVKASTINPKVGIVLVQNQSAPVQARKVVVEGSLENSMVENNKSNIPVKYSKEEKSMYTDTPWNPGIQYANQRCFQVTYGTVKEDWGARPEYIAEYADPETGEAPDVAILAAQKGTEDRSFVPADVAKGQYEIVLENGERIPCDYDIAVAGKDYSISKKAGVELKMAVPDEDVISSEGENLEAGKLYMVDSMGHFYNGNPIKRIKSGEVTWNANMEDPVQKLIKYYIDESLSLEAETKSIKKEIASLKMRVRELLDQAEQDDVRNTLQAKELELQAKDLNEQVAILQDKANEINAKVKYFTKEAESKMTEWVKSAQNPEGVSFFAE